MRIVSGKYRGKKLKEFDLDSTKPTLDRVKESIFNLIQFEVVDACVLDLFAGTGALGIECISRGAKHVSMVDINPLAIKIINENLKGIEGEYQVYNQDYMTFLKNNKNIFDIILLDPPYKTDMGIKAIEYIINNNLLSNNGVIVFETADDIELEMSYDDFTVKRKKYGTVAVYKIERSI